MKRHIFQFSLIDDEDLESSLKKAIVHLGGDLDDSPYYSRRATHLIVDRLKPSEKFLCFIASGKWILSHKYITDSLSIGRFLSEDEYHVSNAFPSSSLASSSIKWKRVIDESKKNAPFINWNVACFISEDEKAQALIRLIKAGGGEAVQLKKMIITSIRFTIVIYDNESKAVGESFAMQWNIPHYPHLLIADHLLYSVPSNTPVLPTKYYDSLAKIGQKGDEIQTLTKRLNMETEETTSEKIPLEKTDESQSQFLAKAIEYFLQPLKFYIKDEFHKIKLVEWNEESRFSNLWKNEAYSQALYYLKNCDNREILSSKNFILLLEFLLTDKIKALKKMRFVNKLNRDEVEKIYHNLYMSIMGYVIKKLCYFAPCGENIHYYSDVFHSLSMDSRLNTNATNIKQFVDVLYLMCIHDYVMTTHKIRKTKFIQNGALIVDKMYNEKKLRELVELLIRQEEVCESTYEKMIQIIAFCHKHYENSRLCERLVDLYYSEEPLNPKSPVSLQSVFKKAITSL